MRIALLSDVHGNLIALEAVLADLKAEHPDRIVCLGDVTAFGPEPRRVLARLQALNCAFVMGNTDEWTLNPQPAAGDENSRRLAEIELWGAQKLDPSDLGALRTFKPTLEIELDHADKLVCFHGTPQSNVEGILSTTPEEDVDRTLAGIGAGLVAMGHTHTQMVRRYRDMLLVNPGSVGLPFERKPGGGQHRPAWAEYALVTATRGHVHVDLRRVAVDKAAIIRAAIESGMPHADWWTGSWRV